MSGALSDRRRRVADVLSGRVPDRVPLFLKPNYYAARHGGISYEDVYYDQPKWLDANRKTIEALQPDMFFLTDNTVCTPGPVHDLLGSVGIQWPGHGVGSMSGHQFIDAENLKRKEYDAFIEDPTDFLIRTYLPRLFEHLAPFGKLPSLRTVASGYYTAGFMSSMFALPDVAGALERIVEAGKIAGAWENGFRAFHAAMAEAGYEPAFTSPPVVLPYDAISGYFRGMKGAMMDMFKCPDKLLAAQAKLLPNTIAAALRAGAAAKDAGVERPRIYIPLHRGADGFMSPQQFETFYWPDLKALLTALIEADIMPMPFFEGSYDSRLAYFSDFPKHSMLGVFDTTDLVRAKALVGDVMCIAGGMPCSLLTAGTPERVQEKTRDLIETVGRDGGFIMCSNTVLDEANPQLLQVWVEATRTYGVYR